MEYCQSTQLPISYNDGLPITWRILRRFFTNHNALARYEPGKKAMRSSLLLQLLILILIAAGYFAFRDNAPENLTEPSVVAPSRAGGETPSVPAAGSEEPTIAIQAAAPAQVNELSDPPDPQTTILKIEKAEIEEQAKAFVEQISEPGSEPLPINEADHFVSQDQILKMIPQAEANSSEIEQKINPTGIPFEKPVAIVNTLPDREEILYQEFNQQAAIDDKPPTVLFELNKVQSPLPAENVKDEADSAVIIRNASAFNPQNLAPIELHQTPQQTSDQSDGSSPTTTVAKLMNQFTASPTDSIYYIRTVKKTDFQGIWGIIFGGLTEKFAKGIALGKNEDINTYQVDIPEQADHALENNYSSFLGRLIYRKTRESYVYNFTEKRMGQNPDLIYPGQELVIVNFEPQELIDIYSFFIQNSKQ